MYTFTQQDIIQLQGIAYLGRPGTGVETWAATGERRRALERRSPILRPVRPRPDTSGTCRRQRRDDYRPPSAAGGDGGSG